MRIKELQKEECVLWVHFYLVYPCGVVVVDVQPVIPDDSVWNFRNVPKDCQYLGVDCSHFHIPRWSIRSYNIGLIITRSQYKKCIRLRSSRVATLTLTGSFLPLFTVTAVTQQV